MRRNPWFEEGLRFECTRCGACCTGEPGFVWVDDAEAERLAQRLNLTAEEFLARFTQAVDGHRSLTEHDNGDCVFWNAEAGCTVYDDRPKQCRSWPFWNSNLRDRKEWRRTERICPGAGNGPVVSCEEILRRSALIDL